MTHAAPMVRLLVAERPRTRGECIDGPRPCPWVGCRAHMLTERVTKDGEVRAIPAPGRPTRPLDEWSDEEVFAALVAIEDTCALDVAARNPDGLTTDELATHLGSYTKDRIRDIEVRALERLGLGLARLEGEEPAR